MMIRCGTSAAKALGILGLAAAMSLPGLAEGGKTFLTKDEALHLVFGGAEVQRTVHALSAAQRKQVTELSGAKIERSTVYAYRAKTPEAAKRGTVYFDVTKVRTMGQVLMVVVGPDATVQRLELLAFAEPLEFIPSPRWYAQFIGKRLDTDLSLKRKIKGVTGASMTARATTQAVRRVLATHAVLNPEPPQQNPPKVVPKKPGQAPDGTAPSIPRASIPRTRAPRDEQ